jgi:hypothetical protein
VSETLDWVWVTTCSFAVGGYRWSTMYEVVAAAQSTTGDPAL